MSINSLKWPETLEENEAWELAESPVATITQLEKLTSHPLIRVRISLAFRSYLSPRLQSILARDRSWSVREDLAKRVDCTSAAAKELVSRCNEHQRVVLANRRETPGSVLTVLSRDESARVRCKVVLNPKASSDILKALGTDNSRVVQANLGKRRKADDRTKEELSNGGSRYKAASDWRTSAVVLEWLADDTDDSVQVAVAGNYHTPAETRLQLVKDADVFYSIYDKKNLVTPEIFSFVVENGDEESRLSAAKAPDIDPDSMLKLASDSCESVRVALAKSASVSLDALEILSQDSSEDVRMAVALNYVTPGFIKEKIPNDVAKALAVSAENEKQHSAALNKAMPDYSHSYDPGSLKATIRITPADPRHIFEYFTGQEDTARKWAKLSAEQIDAMKASLMRSYELYGRYGEFVTDSSYFFDPGYNEDLEELFDLHEADELDKEYIGSWSVAIEDESVVISWLIPGWLKDPAESTQLIGETMGEIPRHWFMDQPL
mgnify:CR=1 FL=1